MAASSTEVSEKDGSLKALQATNFFLADVQTGLGPFLAAYLAGAGWEPGRVGVVLTLGGIVSVVLQTPAGALVDRVRSKRMVLVIASALLACGAVLLCWTAAPWAVYTSQLLIGGAGPFLAPTLAAVTMGLVGRGLFDWQFGKNQSFNSAGNVFCALLIAGVSKLFGNRAIFIAAAILTIPTVLSVLRIRGSDIDYELARGGVSEATESGEQQKGSVLRLLLGDSALLIFLVCAFLFHFANAAMLPQLGEMLSHGVKASATPFMSACIVVTQFVIMCCAATIGRWANMHGRKPLLLLGFGVLPVRALLYTIVHQKVGLVSVQLLDGIANAIFGVVSVLIIADRTRGTGRFNLVQGALATSVGLGAALSTTFGGKLIQHGNYSVSFLALGGVAAAAFALLWFAMPETLKKNPPQLQQLTGGNRLNDTPQPHCFSPNPPDASGVLSWVHVGDLHMQSADDQNYLDLQAIVEELNRAFSNSISFVFLPGDNADHGDVPAYRIVRETLDRLQVPWCAIVGDHDVEQKSLENFKAFLAKQTHYVFTVGNVRFIALNAFDVPQPPSFTVGDEQLRWLEEQLQAGQQAGERMVLLLHCYPSDLKQGRKELERLIADYDVKLIDMGHTHYNEVSHDGRTIYTATRSTGQIEEGPVGFSVTNLDNGVVSWRFLELGALPAVIITSPADERLVADNDELASSDRRELTVRAKVWSKAELTNVKANMGDAIASMQLVPGTKIWKGTLASKNLQPGAHRLRVEAVDAEGKIATDEILIFIGSDRPLRQRAERDQDNALEAWPEHGLLGTQLGPNKNGRKW